MCSLWMGNLDPYMDEDFITKAFSKMGETVRKVRVIRDKVTGKAVGYGFVELVDEISVERCLRKVNGKPLPGSAPPKRFKLSRATSGSFENRNTFSIFVSDITPEVDEGMLYEFFHYHFPSCCSAKVNMDSTGVSKGCGFVSFDIEAEQKRAVTELQGMLGLGKKPLRLSLATNKMIKTDVTTEKNWYYHTPDYHAAQYYYPQYSGYGAAYDWSSYDYSAINAHYMAQSEEAVAVEEEDELEYPDPVNVVEENEKFMDQSEELYSALVGCFSQPVESWDGVTCTVPSRLPEPIYQYEEME